MGDFASRCRFVQAYRFATGEEPPAPLAHGCLGGCEWSEVQGEIAPNFHEGFPLCQRHRELLDAEIGGRARVLAA